jgi:outer membrane usher protein
LPGFNGSAAVPSTVDVYVNNVRTLSQNVPAGPFQFSNVPVLSGPGTVDVVVQDAAGHQTRQSLSFYGSSRLLAPGFTDYSIEAGLPRIGYATTSDTYVNEPVVSGTLRKGIHDRLTIETHGELDSNLVNGGIGLVLGLGRAGIASVAASASRHQDNQGGQIYGSYQTKVGELFINASLRRTFGSYDDLASATSQYQPLPSLRTSLGGFLSYLAPNALLPVPTSHPPRKLVQLSVGTPLKEWTLNAAFTYLDTGPSTDPNQVPGLDNKPVSKIVNLSAARPLASGTLSMTAFRDLSQPRNSGLFAAYSVSLSPSVSATAGVTSTPGSTTGSVEVIKRLDEAPGSYGYRARAADIPSSDGFASASYRSAFGRIEAAVAKNGKSPSGALELEGAIATLGRDVFLSNRIDDSFAVVQTGVPGLDVYNENRLAAKTDANGNALLPRLRAYQVNKIAVDPTNLPLDSDIETAHDIVAPADRSGIRVDLKVHRDIRAAVVVFVGADGKPLPAGATGQVAGGESFFVGYDGRAYIKKLAVKNSMTVSLSDGPECRAEFDYTPHPNQQVVISPVVCR